jgi:hypothetical protein
MKAVTSSGDFDNRIAVGRTLFWLPVLDRLSRLTGDGSFAELAADAKALLSLGQMENGGYADHYDPGWPAEPFDLSRFSAYAKDGSVVADDSLRAALAAEQAGDHEAVARFTRWLPSEQGRIVGYLNLESGEPHFPAGNKKYFDLISSALYYRLSSAVRADDVNAAVQFLTKTQAANGGWHWGWDAHKNAAIDSNQSTLTGLWILTDLSPLG